MMDRKIAIVATAMLLAGCGRHEAPKQPQKAQLIGKKLDPKDQNAKVTRMFAVQGRWQGQPDPANHGRYLVVDVAGGSQYNMDLKGVEGGKEAVFASATGTYAWNDRNLMDAHATSGAAGPLAAYGNWQAGFPSASAMTVRNGSRDIQLTKVQ